ncbi:MAG: DUF1512 family protein [Candidatus Aenigmatarchaeota archaeon]
MIEMFGDISWILFIIFFLLFPIIYPRMVLAQSLYFLNVMIERFNNSLENSKRKFLKLINSKVPSNEVFEMLDFFSIEPTSLDPFGIVKKFELIVDQTDEKLENFIRKISNEKDEEKIKNFKTLYQILIVKNLLKKILEHYKEIIRKYKNIQIAFLVNFQLPIIERIFNSYQKGFETISNNLPIGDGIGPLIIANLISEKDKIKEMHECIIVRKKLYGKNVVLVRAKGPGSRLGKLHKVVEEIVKKEKIEKIITIDAALKLEGEKSGSIAEGVGVAIGGIGIEKFNIEEIALKYGIKLEAIAVKMSQEEAIKIMNPEIYAAKDRAIKKLKELIEESKGKVLIIGVGNSVGIPNTLEEIEKIELEKKIRDFWEKFGKEIERESWLDKVFGI